MRTVSLHCHPATPGAAILAVDVDLLPSEPGSLALRYRLYGEIAALRVPASRPSQRSDELWRHTCCELFIGSPADEAYSEFNFSPSGEWAAYGFQAYRQGMQPLAASDPGIRVRCEAQLLSLEASVNLDAAVSHRALLALAAVIEETDGRLSYWALRHPADKPDFHHRDGLALTL